MYLWFKVFHIVFMVSWFAGMFYIWRLFVYHAETDSEDVRQTLMVMEKKLYQIIMTPAMVLTAVFGTLMLMMQWHAFGGQYWLWSKMALVLALLHVHFMANKYRKKLAAGENFPSRKFRILNEIPTILLITIVILVIIKPFQ